MALIIANASALAACNAVVDLCDAGATAALVNIYDGSVPADADTAISTQTLLAQLTMSDPAFGNAADATPGATATASAITDDSSANATGTATFFRVIDSDLNVIWQGAVGTSGQQLNLDSVSIVTGGTVSITSMTFTCPESA